MVKYWLLNYPRQNMDISLRRNVIGGRSSSSYERRYKDVISSGDKIVFYITGDYKIKGYGEIRDYYYDESPIWPERNGEVWPHRRNIIVEKIFDSEDEKDIRKYYQTLEMLNSARSEGLVLGKSFGNLIRGTTPIEISQNDYNLLTGQQVHLLSKKNTSFY